MEWENATCYHKTDRQSFGVTILNTRRFSIYGLLQKRCKKWIISLYIIFPFFTRLITKAERDETSLVELLSLCYTASVNYVSIPLV